MKKSLFWNMLQNMLQKTTKNQAKISEKSSLERLGRPKNRQKGAGLAGLAAKGANVCPMWSQRGPIRPLPGATRSSDPKKASRAGPPYARLLLLYFIVLGKGRSEERASRLGWGSTRPEALRPRRICLTPYAKSNPSLFFGPFGD